MEIVVAIIGALATLLAAWIGVRHRQRRKSPHSHSRLGRFFHLGFNVGKIFWANYPGAVADRSEVKAIQISTLASMQDLNMPARAIERFKTLARKRSTSNETADGLADNLAQLNLILSDYLSGAQGATAADPYLFGFHLANVISACVFSRPDEAIAFVHRLISEAEGLGLNAGRLHETVACLERCTGDSVPGDARQILVACAGQFSLEMEKQTAT